MADTEGTQTQTTEQSDLAAYTALIPETTTPTTTEQPAGQAVAATPDTPEAAETATETDTAGTVATETEPETEPERAEAKPEHRPGTPDKALQKIQQQLAALTGKIESLEEARESKGALTEKQASQLASAKEQADDLAAMLKEDYQVDLSEPQKLAKRVLQLEAQVRETATRAAEAQQAASARAYWDDWTAAPENKGLNGRDIWENAVKEAEQYLDPELLGDRYDAALRNAATKVFEKRVDVARKSVAGKASAAAAPVRPAAHRPPPSTPGGGRVTLNTGSQNRAVPDSNETTLEEYANLIPR